MNKLSTAKRAQIISCLVEGCSIRSTSRMTGVAFNTVLKLVPDIGEACLRFQDRIFRNLKCQRLQCDEIWSFVACKARQAKVEDKGKRGDVWTWTAIDADTKLIPAWHIGNRDAESAKIFIDDLASRLANKVQLTTDAYKPYLTAINNAFGNDIDYARLIKLYGSSSDHPHSRYSPPPIVTTRSEVVIGEPDAEHISTSFVERQNLNIRMGSRRFTRLTNAFSKKVENHKHALSLNFMHHNFCRIHQTLHITPAMAAGITNHVWSHEEVAGLLNHEEQIAA